MDGRRITASPRPHSGRRVVAKKRPRGGIDGFVNSVKKLQRREICSKRDRAFRMCDAQERFRNIRLQEEYDTHDPKGHCSIVLPFLKKRSKIIEIVAARDIVFALAQSGVCAAFSRETNDRICFLNVSPDESESLKWPGFVEFDDVNGKVLTFSAQDSIYKVFDLKNYTLLYSISDKSVQEIKISPGIMLLIYNKASGYVPLKILSIEDGTVLKSFNHLLHRNKKVDFIEQFNEKLLVKQENENLQILDVRNSDLTEVSRTEFMTPSAFIFLYENQLFLTFRNRTVAVWNFRGELVTSFEDHLLWHPDCNTNNIYITSDQDLIISYCKAESDDPLTEGNGKHLAVKLNTIIYHIDNILVSQNGIICNNLSSERLPGKTLGLCPRSYQVRFYSLSCSSRKVNLPGKHLPGSINISNILTGKCLAKIKAKDGVPMEECDCGSGSGSSCKCRRPGKRMRREMSSVTEALEDITALFYDEERNEIYTEQATRRRVKSQPSSKNEDQDVYHFFRFHKEFLLVAQLLEQIELMEMEGGIDPYMPLDYVELQIFPSQNRYEAYVSSSNRAEKVASGTLEQLLLHSPRVKDLSSTGLNTNFKILPPDNANDAEWFTTATFTRFLHIVGSPSILSIGNEIGQLEETRKFQLSLSVKLDVLSGKIDSWLVFLQTEVDITSSIDSKNELLRAVDLRLTALKDEIATAFDQATGARCSTKDISDLENFAHHFGAKEIRDTLQKFVEMSLFPSAEDSRNKNFNKTENSAPALRPSQLDPPIKYGVSPAKAAQVERQGSTDDENSSFSSEDDQPSVERSRAPTRSATPRRSASPMRRIQIGRSGSRRAAALTIKSLNYFPAREKVAFQRDAADNSSDDEDPEKPAKNNVLRMSVQDKISLFESKQRDQAVDVVPKAKTLTLSNTTVGANKAVLRRWSSGMREENVSPERGASEPSGVKVEETFEPEREESYEKHPASIEWSQQKEAELNQMFMEMMENKPVRQRNTTNDINKSKKSTEEKGGFYDHYKQKRDEKLRGEAAGKRAEKEAQFKVMQRFLDERKAEMASTNVIDVNRKNTTATKPQKTQKNSTASINSRKEASKPSVLKKATSKTSPLPATRKSWPSTPSPRATGSSPAKTPTGPTSTSTTPTSRKPLSASSTVRSSTKSDKSQPRSKTPKPTPPDANRSRKTVTEKKQPTVTKSTKTTKAKVLRTPEADNATVAKPSFYNKVTKKGSVVPLETKPFLRKGSGIGPGAAPVVIKTKSVAQPEETLGSSGIPIQSEENEIVTTTECKAPETPMLSPTKCEEPVSSNQVNISGDNGVKRVELSEVNSGTEEESMISPTAWVEVDEDHLEEIIPFTESPVQIVSPKVVAAARIPSPRVRYSLSQMLLEDSSEGDVGEWGNAEHPPALVYHKDSPKGLKRLLKFARKAKAESHLTSWSSPSAFSEGDDEAEESKGQTL
ncbi:hypothetical protein OSB04_017352 [Centaurea solstitialis]|uniref:Uncharacterized protein n=1 Tax=Centaurea solstitialis TaxID=347529 RepID=A0AA38WAL9_9ASTR|nr:hypothetical protein OSB04_017352 [Centaurea solstitialis]